MHVIRGVRNTVDIDIWIIFRPFFFPSLYSHPVCSTHKLSSIAEEPYLHRMNSISIEKQPFVHIDNTIQLLSKNRITLQNRSKHFLFRLFHSPTKNNTKCHRMKINLHFMQTNEWNPSAGVVVAAICRIVYAWKSSKAELNGYKSHSDCMLCCEYASCFALFILIE